MIILMYIAIGTIILSIIFIPLLLRYKKYSILKKYILLVLCIFCTYYGFIHYYNNYISNDSFPDRLPIENAQNLSDTEIVHRIFEQEMEYAKSKPFFIPGNISEYKDIKVHTVPQKTDIFSVVYSVRTTDDVWHAGNGTIQNDFWIINKFAYMRLVKEGNYYRLISIGT